jgi:hypothetical protein
LNFLKDTIGVGGNAWSWFDSYLTGRTQQISVGNVLSEAAKLLFGVT